MFHPRYSESVMTGEYKKALAAAESEMADVERKLEGLERRKAQLRATIAGLRSLMGDPSDPSDAEDMTLTDAIRTVLKGSDQFMSVQQVIVNLRLMGLQFSGDKTATVGAILNRLARTERVIQGTTDDSRVGYKWKTTLGEKIAGGRLNQNRLAGRYEGRYGAPPVTKKT
jgi:hypothetical protein